MSPESLPKPAPDASDSARIGFRTGVKGGWPLFRLAAISLLAAWFSFYFHFSLWLSFLLTWIACGLVCWLVILCCFTPKPLIDDTLPNSDSTGRPMSVSDVPNMILWLILIAIIAPFGLAFFCWQKSRGNRA